MFARRDVGQELSQGPRAVADEQGGGPLLERHATSSATISAVARAAAIGLVKDPPGYMRQTEDERHARVVGTEGLRVPRPSILAGR